jgi:hypothetical protein
LRRIDRGELDPDVLLVCWQRTDERGQKRTSFQQASSDGLVTLGLLEMTKHHIMQGS